jgi:hypothetical protein
MPAKISAPRMKLAIGPAATMAASGALLGRHGRELLGRWRRSLALVAEELDVAAERDRRDLPAGAMAIVEADQLRSETERKS